MTATPAPESVRRLATSIERALTIVQRALRDFEEEQYEPGDPCTQSQRDRLVARIRSAYLTEEERGMVRGLLERGMTYAAARALLARLDERLERRMAAATEAGAAEAETGAIPA